ncbi:MAG: pyridoxamine 5'-phosphate oxidase family protein [Candidatus Marsarchaeota archaeon]|jgi:uncharacterized protein YhbP (UPF0306 family)|nr:pyridoxamine 5'-phosphate oxidase family protein [Candidatus Marsarchaeota archaeon]
MSDGKYITEKELALKLIKNNKYMVLATSDQKLKPWASPILYVHDQNYDFYFLSAIDSVHAKNITSNPQVSIAIFNSTQAIGLSEGIQAEATASVVGKDVITGVINLYCEKLFPDSDMSPTQRYRPDDYLEPAEFRFFKIHPTKVFITSNVDRRVEVQLSETKT